MKKYGLFGILGVLFLTIFTIPVKAKEARLIQTAPAKIELPLIFAGRDQMISQPVDRDLIVAGNNVTVSSTVAGDTYVAGGQVNITGNIAENLIVAGGNVTISGTIGKNLIVAGGEVKIEDSANVNGYVLAGGNIVNINGQFAGPVRVGASEFTVGDKAKIRGDLEADVTKSNVSPTASIAGEKKINIYENRTPNRMDWINRETFSGLRIIGFLSKLIILLILTRLFGYLIKPIAELSKSFLRNLGIGFLILIIVPFLVVGLLATIIGIPLAVIILFVYLLALYLSNLIVAGALGQLIAEREGMKIDNIYLRVIVGFVILTIIELIPVIGPITRFIVMLLGLGLVYRLIRMRRV